MLIRQTRRLPSSSFCLCFNTIPIWEFRIDYDLLSSLYSYPYEENSDINIDMRSIKQKQVNSIAAYTDLQCGTGTVDIERVVLGNNVVC